MAPGNAVVAEWVGPSGHQLFDGTVLYPGVVVKGVGYDEAHDSDYWKVVGDLDSFSGDASTDASSRHSDPSFGTEDGGGGTGRPLTDAQVEEDKKSLSSKSKSKAEASTVTTTAEVTQPERIE